MRLKKYIPSVLCDKYHLIGLMLVLFWLVPLILSGTRIEYGDFSYFSQVQEAIKISITKFHQFPWWNSWIAGGVPLYANPQAGVFSIPTLLSFFMPVTFALKLTVALFYVLGYTGCLYLLRLFHVKGIMSAVIGIAWVTNGFFVAHMPAHYTFIWFLLMPGYIYLAATLKTKRSGVVLGLALAAMALAQLHYSFIQISVIVAAIITYRLIYDNSRRDIARASAIAVALFLLLATHRILFTLAAVRSFPREVIDPASRISESVLGFLLPYSYNFGYFDPPTKPYYGWQEQTVHMGIGVVIALVISIVAAFKFKRLIHKTDRVRLYIVGSAFVGSFLIGLGDKAWFMPYHLLKKLPLLGDTRISARWFIVTVLMALLFIAIVYRAKIAEMRRWKQALIGCMILGIVELFVLNFGYQYKVLQHRVVYPPKTADQLTFQQQIRFGESKTSPDGIPIPGADRQYLYREYESTMFNMGTILANEVYVDLFENKTARCSYVNMCGLVLTKNADIAYWSPNKIILKRTAKGPISLNMNSSKYLVINGRRMPEAKVANLKDTFTVPVDDAEQTVILAVRPTL